MNQAKAYAYDMSEHGVTRIAGADALFFLRTMCSADFSAVVAVGDNVQGLFLNSQGEIIELATIFMTGDSEYLVLTSPQNHDELIEWLEAHSQIADEQGRVFPNLELDDQSDKLGVLMIYGPSGEDVLGRLKAAQGKELLFLDFRIEELAYGIPSMPAFMLVAPLTTASEVGELLSGYLDLEVEYPDQFNERLLDAETMPASIYGDAYVKPKQAGLENLLRPEADFVGARALV